MNINEFFTSNVINWFQLIGSVLAFVLTAFAIRDFMKKRVSLSINLKQKKIESTYSEDNPHSEITVKIVADIVNKGLEPTTISGVTFYSDREGLNDIKVENYYTIQHDFPVWDFAEIRMEPNDRKEVELHIYQKGGLPEEGCEINGKMVFKTSKKDISKEIKLIYEGRKK